MIAVKQRRSQRILNCDFDPVTEEDVLDWAKELLTSSHRGYISTVNVAILMMMRRDERLRNFMDASTLTVADGQPIIWLSKLLGKPLPERVAGIDLCAKIATLAADNNHSIFLMGATDKILDLTEKQLLKDNPRLRIAGKCNGYFKQSQTDCRVRAVKESGADILFVAMGVPRQEYFVQENWGDLGVKLSIALGGSFDVISGEKQRAPKWMQIYGLEWCFRLLQEPRRLAMRYAITNTEFLRLSAKELLSPKKET